MRRGEKDKPHRYYSFFLTFLCGSERTDFFSALFSHLNNCIHSRNILIFLMPKERASLLSSINSCSNSHSFESAGKVNSNSLTPNICAHFFCAFLANDPSPRSIRPIYHQVIPVFFESSIKVHLFNFRNRLKFTAHKGNDETSRSKCFCFLICTDLVFIR